MGAEQGRRYYIDQAREVQRQEYLRFLYEQRLFEMSENILEGSIYSVPQPKIAPKELAEKEDW